MNESHIRNKGFRLLLYVIIAVAGALGLFSLCSLGVAYYLYQSVLQTAEGDAAIIEIETVLETQLPESADDVYFYYTHWLDWHMMARFNLPADEVESWLATSGLCFDLPLR